MPIDDRPTIAAPDDDPYLWLEEIEGERALAFVEQQNSADAGEIRRRRLCGGSRHAGGDLRPAGQHSLRQRGAAASLYNLWKDANNPRGLWRRTTLDEFRKAEPAWEILLDLDGLAAEEGEDWTVGRGADAAGKRRARSLSLSRGGSDAVTLREFDLETKAFVAGGFALPEAKGGAAWLDADTLLLSSAYGEGMATTSGYARTVRLWRRGTDVLTGAGDLRDRAEHMARMLERRPHRRSAAGLVRRAARFLRLSTSGSATRPAHRPGSICRPTSGWMAHRDWLAVKRRTAWTVGGRGPTRRTPCSAFRCRRFLAGDRDFTMVFEPAPRRALQGFFWCRRPAGAVDPRRTAAGVRGLDAVGQRLDAATRLPGLPEIGVVDVWRLDAEEAESNGDLLANVQDPLTPPSLMLIEGVAAPDAAEAGAADLLRRRARGHAARGHLDRRRAHSLCADRAGRPRPAMRRSI